MASRFMILMTNIIIMIHHHHENLEEVQGKALFHVTIQCPILFFFPFFFKVLFNAQSKQSYHIKKKKLKRKKGGS